VEKTFSPAIHSEDVNVINDVFICCRSGFLTDRFIWNLNCPDVFLLMQKVVISRWCR